MRAVLQRVSQASVSVDKAVVGSINQGLMVLLGISIEDSAQDVEWLAAKIANMRIFSDEQGLMNKSIIDIAGNILLVSQFTLHASTKKGNRPSFIAAARPEQAIPLYESMKATLAALIDQPIACGIFGADMQVQLINDGPVTIVIDSAHKE
jgi:D-aminoacyl-tRNA deacylase